MTLKREVLHRSTQISRCQLVLGEGSLERRVTGIVGIRLSRFTTRMVRCRAVGLPVVAAVRAKGIVTKTTATARGPRRRSLKARSDTSVSWMPQLEQSTKR